MLLGRFGMINLEKTYKGKTVLITGHTGFKGAWLSIWLKKLGANVIGYALDPESENGVFKKSNIGDHIVDIRGDINDIDRLNFVFEMHQPDFVFHLAAQPLVRKSYIEPVYTYKTNVIGTVNVLECIRKMKKKCVGIMITTDKVYENNEAGKVFVEDDKFGGYDPYSSSKAACEIAISSYRRSFMNPEKYDEHGKTIASVRAGNVIGGGDFAKDRIVPDCIRSLEKDEPIIIRNPNSVRPFELVLEPLYGYLLLGYRCIENPTKYATSYNFGPDSKNCKSVKELVETVIKYYGKGTYQENIDINAAHEAKMLQLDVTKAKNELGWIPTFDFDKTIEYTCKWYKEYKRTNVYDLCVSQIDSFSNEVKHANQ